MVQILCVSPSNTPAVIRVLGIYMGTKSCGRAAAGEPLLPLPPITEDANSFNTVPSLVWFH